MYYVHGHWYSPNVGRFISPDEKGEYLYGSGEDAVNYVWAAGQGAICQFVNDEALGEPAAFDQFLQDITNGERVTGYTTLCVENQGGDAFNFGTYFGRGASYAVSIVEIVGGIDMIVGGGVGGAVTCPVTLGGGCVAGAGAVVVGAAGVVHGGAVLVRNLNAPIMRAQGSGNVSGGTLTSDQVLNAAERSLGKGYREIAPGVYRSADGSRQFRMTDGDLLDPKQGAHVHFESIASDGRSIIENAHVIIRDQ
ncbi:MAG: hypothetical protein EYC68_14955 [Chloroflexota bacterium]|nr:MAG: hypothetical protein EYC68_14955 [Chloroflexota bacterium]